MSMQMQGTLVHTRTRSTLKAWTERRSGWVIGDDVVTLREFGTDNSFRLPAPARWDGTPLTLGASRACNFRLDHDTVSKTHAQLQREADRWVLADCRSKNGLQVDSVPQPAVQLAAGMVLGIGGVRLVAESLSFIALRCFMSRLIGWDEGALLAVDRALQELRLSQLRRDPLVLVGEGDLTPIARDLHDHMMGPKAPFVTADPARLAAEAETVRTTRNEPRLKEAIAVAEKGTVFLHTRRMPKDFGVVTSVLLEPEAPRVQIIVGGDKPPDVARLRFAGPIYLPPLGSRANEVPHIITEYCQDTLREFDAELELAASDRRWIQQSSDSVADLAKATRRLVALRLDGTIAGAARRLGMAPVSLRKWIGNRMPPEASASSPPRRGSVVRRWMGQALGKSR